MAGTSELEQWVEACAAMTHPKRIQWCDGSQAENDRLVEGMLSDGTFIELNQRTHPDSYLHRSHPQDVARTENVTLICTPERDQAGITNHWMAPHEAKALAGSIFADSMRGKAMHVVPYLMGTPASPFAKVGIEVTDSPYVVANMRIMARVGQVALDHLQQTGEFSPGLHALADLNPDRRYIMHFPQEKLVWSVGSGYGGNALLGKKCLSLRLASWMARDEGWMAEHMLILGLEDPSGQVTYMAAAFPSACGKTNLAMLIAPLSQAGYRVWTVGDDIAWMRIGPDGRLWAMNPEAGMFGVAPGTSAYTNQNALAMTMHDTIFTNVALTCDSEPWWEGLTDAPPDHLTDWLARPVQPAKYDEKHRPAAHPNSRFTVAAARCPSISPHWEDPQGVPISAIIFGGRRARVAPLVYEAFSWEHGVFVGATMASEKTAAADGQVGEVRRDPMAMLPFCGYNMADYFGHWLTMGPRIPRPPQIFNVNWFRRGPDGAFLWPGFGENIRALRWILDRVNGRGEAKTTAIGYVPTRDALDLTGLDLPAGTLDALLSVDHDEWRAEAADIGAFLATFGERLPSALNQEYNQLIQRLG